MSRTDVHAPFRTTEYGRLFVEWKGQRKYRVIEPEYESAFAKLPFPSKHWSRPKAVSGTARQGNRNLRHDIRATIKRGDFDALPKKYSPRHSAVWDCM